MNTPGPKIAFVGLLVRTDDGKTFAVDLDGEDLELRVDIEVPHEEMDVIDFDPDRMWMHVPNRVSANVDGRRRADASKLFVYRLIKDGEHPFPPFDAGEAESEATPNDLREAR